MDFAPSWMDIKKDMHSTNGLPDWCRQIPFQIKAIAIKDACSAFWDAKGKPKFRTRKNPEQSCFIPKSAIKEHGIYPTISGKGLKFHDPLPDNIKDSRLVWRDLKWWIAVPHPITIDGSENQACGIVAIDPGIRTFATFYSPDCSGKIGEGDFAKIHRLSLNLDDLCSRRAKANKKKARLLTKAIRRLSAKIRNLISELHWKTARFLCANFSVILLPTYETKQMVSKLTRKIRSKTVRSMLNFRNHKFKIKLEWMAAKMGKTVISVSEAYTSKTHPQTGEIKNVGAARWIKLLDGSLVDRDIVGAHNILVKYLTESYALADAPAVS